MKRTILVAALVALGGGAQAQVAGGTAVGAAGGQVGAGANVGQALNAATSTVRALDESARDSARAANDRLARTTAPPKGSVDVRTGAAVRVERDARCYDGSASGDADLYDPTYRDGTYYCERRSAGTGAAVGAEVKTPG